MKQWLLVGGPGNGQKHWHDASLTNAPLSDPTNPMKVHYYVGKEVEVDGAMYQVGVHADVFDDVDLISAVRAAGLQPFRRGPSVP